MKLILVQTSTSLAWEQKLFSTKKLENLEQFVNL